MLRITELLPDPIAPGADAAHEWVELANLGEAPALLGGLVLRDNETTVALAEVTLPAGAAIVIGGPLAEVERALLYRPAGGLGRGLATTATASRCSMRRATPSTRSPTETIRRTAAPRSRRTRRRAPAARSSPRRA
jgi:hypothetical protein